RVILFVKTAPNVELTEDLKTKLKKSIRENCSPRHVPNLILPVNDIPVTLNGKKVEIAVRNVIENKPVTNREALLNPEALDQFVSIAALQA
ncbi:MAG TPA: acetoacetate--CoA ligase, partial [Desulfomonilaceae bacterium]|nr:acetoacetate--CoA ligase [Desulfomonilaceae bacterium]